MRVRTLAGIIKNMMKFLFVTILSPLLFSATAIAEMSVASLNNNDSIRTYISVPFATTSTLGPYKLAEVRVRTNNSCKTLIDPYISSNFFLKCTQPGEVALEIVYITNGVPRSTFYSGIPMISISETGTIIDDDGGGQPSEEWLLGQSLWRSSRGGGAYRSCESCHGSPGSKAHSISLSSLNSAYINTEMSTRAIVLNEAEKQALINFVKSYK